MKEYERHLFKGPYKVQYSTVLKLFLLALRKLFTIGIENNSYAYSAVLMALSDCTVLFCLGWVPFPQAKAQIGILFLHFVKAKGTYDCG